MPKFSTVRHLRLARWVTALPVAARNRDKGLLASLDAVIHLLVLRPVLYR